MRIALSTRAIMEFLLGGRDQAKPKVQALRIALPDFARSWLGGYQRRRLSNSRPDTDALISTQDCQTCRFWNEHHSAVRQDGKLMSVCFCDTARSAGHFTIGTDSCAAWESEQQNDQGLVLHYRPGTRPGGDRP